MAMVVEQVTEALKSSVRKYVQSLENKIASLEKKLQEKDKLLVEVQVRLWLPAYVHIRTYIFDSNFMLFHCHAVTEV